MNYVGRFPDAIFENAIQNSGLKLKSVTERKLKHRFKSIKQRKCNFLRPNPCPTFLHQSLPSSWFALVSFFLVAVSFFLVACVVEVPLIQDCQYVISSLAEKIGVSCILKHAKFAEIWSKAWAFSSRSCPPRNHPQSSHQFHSKSEQGDGWGKQHWT